MRAKLIEFLPDIEVEVEKKRLAIAMSPSTDDLDKWVRDVEHLLSDASAKGFTNWRVISLPNLADLCTEAYSFVHSNRGKGNSEAILKKEIIMYCKRFEDHWREFSDVYLSTNTDVSKLWRRFGQRGLEFHFDWTPTEAELQRKKLKIGK